MANEYLDNVIYDINSRCVALCEQEKRRNAVIVREVTEALEVFGRYDLHCGFKVLDDIVQKMRKNPLFDSLYNRNFFGGSYFDKLKVSKPNEYDLDLLLVLPKETAPEIYDSDRPGFVNVSLQNMAFFSSTQKALKYPNLTKLVDSNNYLSVDKTLSWIESLITNAVNEFYSPFPQRDPSIKAIQTNHSMFYFKVHKSGPAFTLKLASEVDGVVVKINIDLVPCFKFLTSDLPESYKGNPYIHYGGEFFVVPKKPSITGFPNYWRMSFQMQERKLIHSKQRLKPTLRLLKLFRDANPYESISSYYIKTIFLWEVISNPELFDKQLSVIFLIMMIKFQQHVQSGEILYFWNRQYNLIERMSRATLYNIAQRIERLIRDVQVKPGTLVDYLRPVRAESVEDFWSSVEELPAKLKEPASSEGSWCTLL